jgi:hypothetical protein
MEIQVGDRLNDHGFEWEVLTRPAALHGGKSLRARIQRPGVPETEREMTWQAHEGSRAMAPGEAAAPPRLGDAPANRAGGLVELTPPAIVPA